MCVYVCYVLFIDFGSYTAGVYVNAVSIHVSKHVEHGRELQRLCPPFSCSVPPPEETWETGSEQQSSAYDRLLKILKPPPLY